MMSPLLTTTDLIREDVLEFSRLHEINTMRVCLPTMKLAGPRQARWPVG